MGNGYATYRVDGAKEMRRTLKKAGDDLTDLKSVHSAIAQVVVPVAVREAPKRSGALASSVRGAGTKTSATVRAGSRAVPYANVIQWGWGRHGIAAQPFMTRAAKQTEPVWVALYTKETQRILDKVKGA